MKVIPIIAIFLCMIILGVSPRKDFSIEEEKNEIVLIVHDHPSQDKISLWSSMDMKMPPPLYILDNFYTHDLGDNVSSRHDTVTYTPTDNYVLLKYRYNDFYESEITLQGGDTVLISFNDRFPLRYKNSLKLDIDSLVWGSMTKNARNPNINAMLEYKLYPAIVNSSRFTGSKVRQDTLTANAIAEVKTKIGLLNNLYQNQEIDSLLYNVKIKDFKLDLIFLQFRENGTKEEYLEIIKSIQQDEIKPHIKKICDISSFYIKRILTQDQASITDDKYIDFINSPLFVPEVRDYLFYDYIKSKAEQLSLVQIKELHKKFAEKAVLTQLVGQIETQYFPFESSSTNSELISLINMDNTKLSLETVLTKDRDKIFYVDFWASWCIPCVEQMPFADTLQQKFENEKIVFINISIDKNVEHWKSSVLNNGLTDQEHNYLFIDYTNSKWAKEVKLQSIPRYMVFDATGKVLVNNALSPEEILRKPAWLYNQIEDNL